jgi:hypothetical protein
MEPLGPLHSDLRSLTVRLDDLTVQNWLSVPQLASFPNWHCYIPLERLIFVLMAHFHFRAATRNVVFGRSTLLGPGIVREREVGPAFCWTMLTIPGQRRLTSSLSLSARHKTGSIKGARLYGLRCATVLCAAASSSPRDLLIPQCFHFSQPPIVLLPFHKWSSCCKSTAWMWRA